MHRRFVLAGLAAGVATLLAPSSASAFCGFYVGKADAKLFNQASQVVLVRDGERTVVTMSNDYQGPLKDFALVVPVPTVLQKGQIHVGERKYIERLDAWSAPRLVEYHDPDPCYRDRFSRNALVPSAAPTPDAKRSVRDRPSDEALGVKVEARYTIGEYDILMLSAKESSGLEIWLRHSGYKIPEAASRALEPYIKQDMKFFVAKVNLGKQEALGFKYLRPIQIAYESKKFMLPIRLGMANANGPQDLVIYTITKNGRVESSNYRTVKMPTGMDIPVYVKNDFEKFYVAAFERLHEKEDRRAIFTEYVWDMGWCDPCSADPLTPQELRQLGVFWLGNDQNPYANGTPILTRMHVRYDDEHFPSDLVFQETSDRQQFQARYVLRNPYKGDLSCEGGQQYLAQLHKRQLQEAQTLADLTGWDLRDIRRKMGLKTPAKKKTWWESLWQ